MNANGFLGRMKIPVLMLVVSLFTTMCAPIPTQTPGPTQPEAATSVPLAQITQPATQAATQVSRPILRIATETGLDALDPENNQTTLDNEYGSAIYEELVGRDAQYNLAPGLALSWKQVDTDTWELKLRQGVKFQDGTPFNAEAVKYNIERTINPKLASRSGLFTPYLAGAVVVDEYTVQIKTVGNCPFLPYVLASGFLGMVSPTAAEKYGSAFSRNPVGTGPFKFVKWVENQYVEMTANDDYWGGAPKLGGLYWKIIPDQSSRALALESGDVDLISNPPPEMFLQFKSDPKYQVTQSETNIMVALWLNPEVPNLTDLRVRQAILYSIDQQSILTNLVKGLAAPAYQPLGAVVFGMLPPDKVPKGGFYAYDPTKSRQLLAEAGWTATNSNGLLEKDGKTLTVTLSSPSGRYLEDEQIVGASAAYMRAVGIDAKVQVLDDSTLFSEIVEHKLDMFMCSWGWEVGYPEPSFYLVYHSEAPGGQAAWAQWKNPEADKLIEQSLVAPDPAVRSNLYQEISLMIMNAAIQEPIYYQENLWAGVSAIHGFVVQPSGDPAFWTGVTLGGS